MSSNMWKSVSTVLLDRHTLVTVTLVCSIGVLCLISNLISTPAPWHADKLWHDPYALPRCSMDACFNFSRCENATELLIYTYNDPVPKDPPTYFKVLTTGSVWHTSDAEQACLFFYFSDTAENKAAWTKPAFRNLPYWNGGLNHVIVTFADRWADTNPPPETLGKASLVSTKLHPTTYRPEFDVAVPLPRVNPWVMSGLIDLKPFERKYFLTFKGKRYLSREGVFRGSKEFRGMHNGKDVVIVTSCNGKTNQKLLKAHPELGAKCPEDQVMYDSYDYMQLMNSTFGLAPAGRSPASYRLCEVLSAGAVPVLIADNYVKPFNSLIQWQYCLLQFSTNEIHRVLSTLRALSIKEVENRQRYCQLIFQKFLKDDLTLVASVTRSLKERFMGMLPNFPLEEESEFGKAHK